MCGRFLARLAFWWAIAGFGIDVEEIQGTRLAQEATESSPTCTGYTAGSQLDFEQGRQSKVNNGPKLSYCRECQAHWSLVWQAPKRRSRSKSAKKGQSKKTDAAIEAAEGDAVSWAVFPERAPWVPSTPSTRVNAKLTEVAEIKGQQDLLSQPVHPQLSAHTDSVLLSADEEKLLQHLKAIKSMNVEMSDAMQKQFDDLLVKEQMAASTKALTHGHLNRLKKVQNQVQAAAKRVTTLDQEWIAFTAQILEKVKSHAQMYQSCRADLLEQYNLKNQELIGIRKEMSQASASLLGQSQPILEMPELPDMSQQIQMIQDAIADGSQIDQIDLTEEEDEGMEAEAESFTSKVRLSPKTLKPFRNSTSPTKVANQHLKQKPEKTDAKDAKKEEKGANA
eukprot:s255_g41.t1